MKKIITFLLITIFLLSACSPKPPQSLVACTTIQCQIANALAGDTITVSGNHSGEAVQVNKSVSFVCTDGSIVKSFYITANNVSVKGCQIVGSATYGVYSQSKNTVIEGNTITDAIRDGAKFTAASTTGTIRNNIFKRDSQSCIMLQGVGHLVEGNDCSGTIQYPTLDPQALGTDSDADCFRFFGSDHIFRNNYCHDITYGVQPAGNNIDPHTDGFQTWGGTNWGSAHHITFDGNVIILSGSGGGFTNKSVQLGGGAYDLTFTNNIFRTTLGSSMVEPVSNLTFDHNTWIGDKTNSGSWGVNADLCTGCVFTNSIFAYYPNGAGWLRGGTESNSCVWQSGGTRKPVNGLVANPLFVNEAANDFRLQTGSPCAGKGVNFDVAPIQTPSVTATLGISPTIPQNPTLQTPSKTTTPTFSPLPPTVTRTASFTPTSTKLPPSPTPTLTKVPPSATPIPFTSTPIPNIITINGTQVQCPCDIQIP